MKNANKRPKTNKVKPIDLPGIMAESEKQKTLAPAKMSLEHKVGFAFVGLGTLTLNELLPAIHASKFAKPVALVTGDMEKAKKVASQYGIPETGLYTYENFDEIKENKAVEAVYIVLPNYLHEDFTKRSAAAGKHVLCEKPLAHEVASAKRMIAACKKANVKLMVAYRMQFEPFARHVKSLVEQEKFGKIRIVDSVNVQNSGSHQWRLEDDKAGGGPLPDIGLYSINTTRYILGEEPYMVLASKYSTPGDARFKEVEESVMYQIFFPSGTISNNVCSYGVTNHKSLNFYGDKGGKMLMHEAFGYEGITLEIAYADHGGVQKLYPGYGKEVNQFLQEIDHFARCIIDDLTPYTTGEEGLQDMIVMEAIYKSAEKMTPVKIKKITKKDAFRGTPPILPEM